MEVSKLLWVVAFRLGEAHICWIHKWYDGHWDRDGGHVSAGAADIVLHVGVEDKFDIAVLAVDGWRHARQLENLPRCSGYHLAITSFFVLLLFLLRDSILNLVQVELHHLGDFWVASCESRPILVLQDIKIITPARMMINFDSLRNLEFDLGDIERALTIVDGNHCIGQLV